MTLDELLQSQTQTSLLAALDAVKGTSDQIQVIPWIPERGCVPELATVVPKESIAHIEPLGPRCYCYGKLLRIVEVIFKRGSALPIEEYFARLMAAVSPAVSGMPVSAAEHFRLSTELSLLSVTDELKAQIDAGRIQFDPPSTTTERLRKELLGENTGTKVTESLQKLVLEVSKLQTIRISSIIRNSGHHGTGRAFDIGDETIASALLPQIATDSKVQELKIDEIIFDASVAGETDRNKWNYDLGQKHNYPTATLNDHKDHIHFAVKAG